MRPSRKGVSVPFGSTSSAPVLPYTLTDRGGGAIGISPIPGHASYENLKPPYNPDDDTWEEIFWSANGVDFTFFDTLSTAYDFYDTGEAHPGAFWAMFWVDDEHPELNFRISNVVQIA